jgi:hypothetical protein
MPVTNQNLPSTSTLSIMAIAALISISRIPPVSSQSILDVQAIQALTKPLGEMLEPYKVTDFSHERGIPSLHEDLGKLFESDEVRL